MNDKTDLLRHVLATLAYRTQKALRGAPAGFGDYRAAPDIRNPRELVRHMTSVLGYARTFFIGGEYRAEPLTSLDDEVTRFHDILLSLGNHFETGEFADVSPERVLQGPLSDAMSHVGQLSLLRRLAGDPVAPENFIMADIRADNVSQSQPAPVAPDEEWHSPAGPQR